METNETFLQETVLLLNNVLRNQEYFIRAIRREIDGIAHKEVAAVTTGDILHARAFTWAYAGLNELARHDLETLISQNETRTAQNVNKLAQVLIRMGGAENLEQAITLSKLSASELAKADSEKWLAHHNLMLAYNGLGQRAEAVAAGDEALAIVDDPRTSAVVGALKSSNKPDVLRTAFAARGFLPGEHFNPTGAELQHKIDTTLVAMFE
jgi:tetratricopeptide (TPR) repeat protein